MSPLNARCRPPEFEGHRRRAEDVALQAEARAQPRQHFDLGLGRPTLELAQAGHRVTLVEYSGVGGMVARGADRGCACPASSSSRRPESGSRIQHSARVASVQNTGPREAGLHQPWQVAAVVQVRVREHDRV
jgi:hypothetical protein